MNENGKFESALIIDCVPETIDPQCCLLADLDNDGHLDIYLVVRNEGDSPLTNLLLKGKGDGRFEDVTTAWGGYRTDLSSPESAIALDFDLDGDLDLMTFDGGSDSTSQNGGVVSYMNQSDRMKGVTIILADPGGTPHGLGARVFCDDQMREVRSIASPSSSSVFPIHFGLNESPGPIEVTIHWPNTDGSMTTQTITLPTSGTAYRITKGAASYEELPQGAER